VKPLIWLLLIAALAAVLSLVAIHNDGYALFVLPPWRVELSLNLLLILALTGFFLLYLLLRGLAALFVLPVSVREYRVRRAREHADSALRDAVMMALEGRYSRALRLAEIAYSAGHAPLLSALVAQQAAHGMRDQHRETVWRDRARQHEDKKNMGARLMVEAGIAADNRDFQTARDLLEQFARSDGRHVAALRLALRVYQGLGQWRDVERVVRQLEKHRAMTPEQAAPLRQRAQREMIAELQHRGETSGQLERFLRGLSDVDRLEPRLVLHAAPLLIEANNHPEAARLIEDALDVRWDSDLVAAYGDCGGDTLAYIANAERWLHAHPHDAKLLLTLGRLCRRQQLWGKAQSYLDASLATQTSRWTHLELAALLDQLGKPDQANVHYRAAAGDFSK
jgi:HemY protein